jgi:circadian clock protein KaiC
MDEFPFFIGDQGFSVLPITSLNLDYGVSPDRVSTGVGGLDAMMEGRGLYRSSAGLISGRSGTGKSSLAAAFAVAACERGERCLYFSLEESPAQITRNMKSLGIDFDRWVKKGLLTLRSFRPTLTGLEEHLVAVGKDTEAVNPSCVVLDPITNFVRMGDFDQVQSMLARLLDLFKNRGITLLMTALATGDVRLDETRVNISALVDTWIAVDVERIGHLGRRVLYIIKSRGMEHSHQTCELRMSRQGLSIGEITAEAPL